MRFKIIPLCTTLIFIPILSIASFNLTPEQKQKQEELDKLFKQYHPLYSQTYEESGNITSDFVSGILQGFLTLPNRLIQWYNPTIDKIGPNSIDCSVDPTVDLLKTRNTICHDHNDEFWESSIKTTRIGNTVGYFGFIVIVLGAIGRLAKILK